MAVKKEDLIEGRNPFCQVFYMLENIVENKKIPINREDAKYSLITWHYYEKVIISNVIITFLFKVDERCILLCIAASYDYSIGEFRV